MVGKVELIPLSEGNRIAVEENDKVIIGRGSSLGCNEKKISRYHAELLLKDDHTLWIKPTHANPVFYRPMNGKTIQLAKDIERELKDGDQIGLLPSSFFFRVSFSTDVNNNNGNNDFDLDSPYPWKKEEKFSPVRATSPDQWSPTGGYQRSASNQDSSVFDFDEDIIVESIRIPAKRVSIEKNMSTDVEPEPSIPAPVPSISLNRVSVSSSPAEDEDGSESSDTNTKSRKLPKWMATTTSSPVIKHTATTTSSPVIKHTATTPKSSYSRNSSYTASTSAKKNLSFEDDNNSDTNEPSNASNVRSSITPSEIKSPRKLLSRIPAVRSFDDDSDDGFDSVMPKSPPKKSRSSGKRRPVCQFGASCYRKNPVHRAEQSHPGDSDHEDAKPSNNPDLNDDDDTEKPVCPFGKSCYRQNPQHKRDFQH